MGKVIWGILMIILLIKVVFFLFSTLIAWIWALLAILAVVIEFNSKN